MSKKKPFLLPAMLFLLAAILLVSCQPSPAAVTFETAWQPGDLRALEAPNTPDPNNDLIAAYARLTATDLELRFDLLGSPDPFGYDLYVILDTGQGEGGRLPLNAQTNLPWDIALGFPGQGLPRAFDPGGTPLNIRPRILRDSVQDAAIIRLSRRELTGDPLRYRFQAFLVKSGADQPADSIGPLRVDGAAPDVQAPLFLAFWNSFPSATPAQALRRWNGAHTGPYGQRHGLSVLLHAASQSRVPVAVLDLKQAGQLSALEAVGGLSFIRGLQKNNLLVLPDLAYGDPQTTTNSLQSTSQTGQRFGMLSSPFFYGPSSNLLPGKYQAAFARLQDTGSSIHLRLWNSLRLVPLPGNPGQEDEQANEEGLTLASRTALLNAALSPDPSDLVVFGGSLPDSPWGDSLIAAPALQYIAGHPWVRPLTANGILQFPAGNGAPDCADLLCQPEPATTHPQQDTIRKALQDAPAGLFRDLAWQTYLSLTEPATDPRLQTLRAAYLGQVGPLLAAARWSASPAAESTCAVDANWDGAPDCILSSPDLFLVLDPQGGRLVFAAARVGNEPVELVGPRSQFIVGLGDPIDWHPERGLAGDPQEIAGAFADPTANGQTYQAAAGPGEVIFTNPQNSTQKTFRLRGQSIQVTITGQPASTYQMPIALIDQRTYQPGGFQRYHLVAPAQPGSWDWELAGGFRLNLSAQGAALTANTFADSRTMLNQPEDPNAEYPPGHFLPFPLAVIDLSPQGNFSVEIRVEKK